MMQNLKNLFLRKKTWGIILLLALILVAAAGITVYRLPKHKVLRAFARTFYTSGAPLSIQEPLTLLQNGEATLELSLVLEQLELPALSALSDQLSLLEGLTLDSSLHYSLLQERFDGTLSLSYLYKPYLNASVYAQGSNLYLKAPELIDNYFKIDTFGIPLFPQEFSFVRSCLSGSHAGETENPLDTLEVTRTDDTHYRLEFSQRNPVSLEIGPDGLISSLSYEAEHYSFSLSDSRLTLRTVLKNPIDSLNYPVLIQGTYQPAGTGHAPSLHLDSIDITQETSDFHLNLSGSLSLEDFQDIGSAPDGKIYDLFHLTAREYTLLAGKVLKNLLATELAPFLAYFDF